MRDFLRDYKPIVIALGSLLVFVLALNVLPVKTIVAMLNSVFIASMAMLLYGWFRLSLRAIDRRPVDDVSQLTIGTILPWLVIGGGTILSIAMASNNDMPSPHYLVWVAWLRYGAILAAWFQLSALGVTRYNRRLIFASATLAAVIFVATIWMQSASISV